MVEVQLLGVHLFVSNPSMLQSVPTYFIYIAQELGLEQLMPI